MSKALEQNVVKVLSDIINPVTKKSVVDDVSKIIANIDSVTFAIYIDPQFENQALELREICIRKIKEELGIEKVNVALTAHNQQIKPSKRQPIQGVRKVIVVASGKGGVGKSTIAINLAMALKDLGYKVGIADVDIYGPSLPTLLGVNSKPVLENDLMLPIQKFGMKAMSIGFLVPESDPLIWRGPMTTKMLYQLLRLTKWDDSGDLDYLIIDTPPGTGDVHLSLAENYKIDGVVVVTLPQDLSVKDARKSMAMYTKLDIPILGIIENMSFDGNSGKYIFGKGGAKKLAAEFAIPILAELPLFEDISICSDMGKPIVYCYPEHPASEKFKSIASLIAQ